MTEATYEELKAKLQAAGVRNWKAFLLELARIQKPGGHLKLLAMVEKVGAVTIDCFMLDETTYKFMEANTGKIFAPSEVEIFLEAVDG